MDRMGLGQEQASRDVVDVPNTPPMEQPTQQETGFIVATELVDLPTKGLFYDEGHPLHNQETIEIKHLTTKEEDILTNQSFLKNGTAIDRMLQSILIDKRVKVKDLFVGDKNALIVASRIYGYGPDYDTKFSCPSCGTAQQTTFDLHEMQHVDFQENQQEYEVVCDYETKSLFLNIPRTNTKLELRLIKEDKANVKNKNNNNISHYYKKIIKSVNGNSDPRYILSYINSMTALDSRFLRNVYYKIVPGVDFSVDFECSNCGYQSQVEVPLNAEFFWPN